MVLKARAQVESGQDFKPKVLFLIGSLERGGAEHQMVLLAEGLAHLDWPCMVSTLIGDGTLGNRLDAAGIANLSLPNPGRSKYRKFANFFRAPFRLFRFLRRYRPDVVHAFLPHANLVGAVVGRLARVPLVITSRRGLGTHQDRQPIWKLLDRLANALSDAIVCNSRAVCEDVRARDAVHPDKLRLIYNGLEVSVFDAVDNRESIREELGLMPEEFGLLTVANLIPYKGHADLLEAIAQVDRRVRKYKCFLAGRDDGIGADLKKRVSELGIENDVVFLGPRSDVPRLLAAMDIFVLPSHEEGLSNALLEAMAAGLAVIATAVGGNSEALSSGEFGELVPAHDPAALAAAIRSTMAGSMDNRARRDRAQAFVRNSFSVDAMLKAYCRLYTEGLRARTSKD